MIILKIGRAYMVFKIKLREINMGALTAVVFSLLIFGWKWFTAQLKTKKQIYIRIVVLSILIVVNIVLIIGQISLGCSIEDDRDSVSVIVALMCCFILPILILLVKRLISDIGFIKENSFDEKESDSIKTDDKNSTNKHDWLDFTD